MSAVFQVLSCHSQIKNITSIKAPAYQAAYVSHCQFQMERLRLLPFPKPKVPNRVKVFDFDLYHRNPRRAAGGEIF